MEENKYPKFIKCAICGASIHSVLGHLREHHSETSYEQYQTEYPNEPLFSESGKAHFDKIVALQKKKNQRQNAHNETANALSNGKNKMPMSLLFDLSAKDCKAVNGTQICVTRVEDAEDKQSRDLVPEIDPNYIFKPEELKDELMAIELKIPCLVWGHKGTGKTEGIEQICARTNRPFMRVQHTVNTEESQILGQWTVKNGETVYQYGALPLAMLKGWVYCADEYDFATPHVCSVYQPVLEGKALVIKDAPDDMRIIKPHPNFRFFATGNTNGTGDDSGLYAGTMVQNSANYDRFNMVIEKSYLDFDQEVEMLKKRVGLTDPDARKFIDFAREIRKSFEMDKISDTISPRALISAGRIGILKANFIAGLERSFIGKLSTTDATVAREIANRVFG